MSDTSISTRSKLLHALEWILVFIGALVCLVVVGLFAAQQPQDLWPLPGLYFIEISLLAILAAVSRMVVIKPTSTFWRVMPWIAGGALFPFVILGGFSIGPFLFPAMLAFLFAGILTDWRQGQRNTRDFALAMLAALLQGFLMIMINLLA